MIRTWQAVKPGGQAVRPGWLAIVAGGILGKRGGAVKQERRTGRKKTLSALWLALGVALLFAGKRWNWPLATLFSPLFLLHYLRMQPVARGVVACWLAQSLALLIIYSGTATGVFGNDGIYAIAMLLASFLLMLPLLADRLLAPSLPPLVATLIFPFARTTLEYLTSINSPYGEWASLATDFAGWLPLAQLASLTGIWGITFLAAWFAAIGNWIWLSRRRTAGYAGIGYGILVLALCVYGMARLHHTPAAMAKVKVAGIVLPDATRRHLPDGAALFQAYLHGSIDRNGLAALRQLTGHTQDYLFQQSAVAAQAGARVIFWAETNALVLAGDETPLIRRGQQFARQYGVYLGMAVLVMHPRLAHPDEDKIILITPTGKVAWQYEKAHPLAGEKRSLVPGSSHVPVLDTPYGRLAAMICYDSDFIRFARQAGAAGADLVFVPSNDWRAISEMRARITRYRAIENGVTLVRPTSHGISEIVGPDGRLLASRDFYTDPAPVLLADVPVQGRRTLYAQIGDSFAWFCLAGLVALGILAVWRRPARRHALGEAAG
jgi:apolipoprotein N-acyltransferase